MENNQYYKKSVYNFTVTKEQNRELICNLRTLSIAWIDSFHSHALHSETPIALDDEFSKMLRHGFIVPQSEDEFRSTYSKRQKYINNQKTEHMTFVFAPSMLCNYKCKYCFESDIESEDFIKDTDVIDIVNFLIHHISNNTKCKYVHLTFFGGEPTLFLDILCNVGYRLKCYCSQKNITFDSSIVSNGYLLNRAAVQTLSKFSNLIRCQITIDGTEEYYSYIKQVPRSYYQQVINNVHDIFDQINVIIRINVGINNKDDSVSLINELLIDNSLNKKIKLYVAPIINYNACKVSDLFDQNSYRQYCDNLRILFKNLDIHYLFQRNIPTLKPAFCGAMKKAFLCIGPDKKLYRCEHYIGRKWASVGDIYQGYQEGNAFDKLFLGDLPKKCYSCKYNIICQGGCQANRLLDKIEPDCDNMENEIRWEINNLLLAQKGE